MSLERVAPVLFPVFLLASLGLQSFAVYKLAGMGKTGPELKIASMYCDERKVVTFLTQEAVDKSKAEQEKKDKEPAPAEKAPAPEADPAALESLEKSE